MGPLVKAWRGHKYCDKRVDTWRSGPAKRQIAKATENGNSIRYADDGSRR